MPLELFDSVLLLASSASSDGEIFASAHAAAAAAGPAGGGAAGGWGGAGGGAGFAGRHSAGGEFVTPSTTDSKTLASLLLIRDIQAARMEAEREQLARGGPSASSSPADVAAGGGGPTIGASASRSLGRVASVGRSAPAPDRLAAVRAAAVALSQPGGGAGSGAGAAPAPRARSCGSGIRGGGGGFGARFSAAAAPEPASPVPASPSIGGIAARVGAAAGSPPRPRGVPTSASSRAAGLWASGGELNAGGCPVVAEILDRCATPGGSSFKFDPPPLIIPAVRSRTRNLVAETGVGDYVLSNSLVSRVLAMVGEDALVADVLAELFSADGSELYVVPARSLVGRAGERASFNELSRRARERGDILLGAYCGEAQGAPGWPRGGATRGGLHGKEGGSDEAEVRAAQRRAMLNPPDKHGAHADCEPVATATVQRPVLLRLRSAAPRANQCGDRGERTISSCCWPTTRVARCCISSATDGGGARGALTVACGGAHGGNAGR